ncbi:MAG: hypothetical protein HFE90_06145 [Firmicutes bacterium]|nr:hypothetical protein [Bacillota bacterium]
MNFPPGFYILLLTIIILILISIQFTLNVILREIREIRKRTGFNMQERGGGGNRG